MSLSFIRKVTHLFNISCIFLTDSPREIITHPQRAHTFLSDVQKDVLLQAFFIQPRPSREQLTQLAEHLGLEFDRVRRWFASRRGREKKKHYKKLRDLEALASSLSSSKQPIIQAQPVRSCSYYGYQARVPSFCRNSSPYRNRGLVPRNMVGPMPVYRHPPQQSRVNTGSKQLLPCYQTTHDLRHSSLIQLNTGSLHYSLPRPVPSHQRVPVYQFRV